MLKLRQLRKKEKIFLFIIVGFLFSLATEKLFLSSLRQKLTSLRQNIRFEETRLKKFTGIQKIKSRIEEDFSAYRPYLEARKTDKRDITTELLREIERLAKEAKATIINLTPQDKIEDVDGYKKIKANLRMEASMKQVFSFLSNMQESNFLLKLEKLSFSPKDEQAAVLKVETVMSLALLD